jgi:hypothetical protein
MAGLADLSDAQPEAIADTKTNKLMVFFIFLIHSSPTGFLVEG